MIHNKTYILAKATTATGIYARLEARAKIEEDKKTNLCKTNIDIYVIFENKSDKENHVELYSAGGSSAKVYLSRLYPDADYREKSKSNAISTFISTRLAPGEISESKCGSINVSDYYDTNGCLSYDISYHYDSLWEEDIEKRTSLSTLIETIEIPQSNRGVDIITADNFTDEGNATFTYVSNNITSVFEKYVRVHKLYDIESVVYDSVNDEITSLKVALSFDGINPDIPYRDLAIEDTSYTFEFTDDEREILREKAQGNQTVPIYYLLKTVRTKKEESKYFYNRDFLYPYGEYVTATQRHLTIVGATPSLNPTVKDINPATIALTGNENIFVQYESTVEFDTGAVASKHATIIEQSVQCGSKIVKDLYNGIIEDIETGDFIFNARDSRNLNADTVVVSNVAMIKYIKPTIKQELKIELSEETGAIVKFKITGNYFNGTFGAEDNTLNLYVRYAVNSGDYGEWVSITDVPEFKDGTYECNTTVTGLTYDNTYTFQCMAVDKLNTVITNGYPIKLLPVYDWSETDFNFNVPVNMSNKTVLRFNEESNNTVLSAAGGSVYIRPKGTTDTTGEVQIKADGSVKFNGAVDINKLTVNGDTFADYVIEHGEQSMGSNGTWYYNKWASGKAECWGCRNYGNMAVNTAWGNLYRSEIFQQELPEDVFITTPDVININIVNGNKGGWICKHEQDAPSAVTTGSFIWVRPASATISPTYIGFHVIGLWRQ